MRLGQSKIAFQILANPKFMKKNKLFVISGEVLRVALELNQLKLAKALHKKGYFLHASLEIILELKVGNRDLHFTQ